MLFRSVGLGVFVCCNAELDLVLGSFDGWKSTQLTDISFMNQLSWSWSRNRPLYVIRFCWINDKRPFIIYSKSQGLFWKPPPSCVCPWLFHLAGLVRWLAAWARSSTCLAASETKRLETRSKDRWWPASLSSIMMRWGGGKRCFCKMIHMLRTKLASWFSWRFNWGIIVFKFYVLTSTVRIDRIVLLYLDRRGVKVKVKTDAISV